MSTVNIAIIGDYNGTSQAQNTLIPALEHAATTLNITVNTQWIPTGTLNNTHGIEMLETYNGIIGGPGEVHYLNGTLHGIRFARENDIPYLGTCAGFQNAVLEFARNTMGIADATSAEFDLEGSSLVVTPLACNIRGQKMTVHIQPETRAYQLYESSTATEEYFCNFGINPAYQEALVAAGLNITATDSEEEPRTLELAPHRFFIASLFVPQTSSTPERPHPLIKGFLAASTQFVQGEIT